MFTVHGVLLVLAVLLVGGVATFLIQKAPFIDEAYKATARWVILALVIVWLLIVVLRALGVS